MDILSYLNKKILIKKNIFLAKRNKRFNQFFFNDNKEKIIEEIYFNFKDNNFNETLEKTLSINGVLVLEEVLSKEEHENFKNDFNLEQSYMPSKIVEGKSSEILMKRIDKEFKKVPTNAYKQ